MVSKRVSVFSPGKLKVQCIRVKDDYFNHDRDLALGPTTDQDPLWMSHRHRDINDDQRPTTIQQTLLYDTDCSIIVA